MTPVATETPSAWRRPDGRDEYDPPALAAGPSPDHADARRLLHEALRLTRQEQARTPGPKSRPPGVAWVRPREVILHLSSRFAGWAMFRQIAHARAAQAWTRDRLSSAATHGRDALPYRRTGRRLAPVGAFGSDPTRHPAPNQVIQR